jgi:porin
MTAEEIKMGMDVKCTGRLLALSAILVMGLSTSSALAEDTGQAPESEAPAGQLDNGLISITKVAPPITKVFDYSGDSSSRGTMLGDWNGRRTELYNNGFTFDANVTQIYQGVVSGGADGGNGGAKYNGLFELNMALDTAKLGLWSGGLIAATVQSSWGNPITGEAGNLSPVNMTPIWPKPFDNSTELMEYYLTQALPGDMTMIVGRIDATNFLDKNTYANNPESQFLNASLNNMLLWGNFLTFSTYGAILVAPVSKEFTIAVAAWTPDTEAGDYGGDWSDYGLVVNPMFNYKIGDKPGSFQAVAAYSSSNPIAFDNPFLVPDIIHGVVPRKSNNWMVNINGSQLLWAPEGALVSRADGGRKEDFEVPTQDFAANPPGIGLFYRFAYTPKDRNPYNINLSGGLGARGIVPGRPFDRMGIGGYWLMASHDLNDQPGNEFGDETGFEAYYNYAITPWLQLSADVQWISPGIKSSKDAVVMATRLYTRF